MILNLLLLFLVLGDITLTYYYFFLMKKKNCLIPREEKGLIGRLVLIKGLSNERIALHGVLNIFVFSLVIIFVNQLVPFLIGVTFILNYIHIHSILNIKKYWNNKKYWKAYKMVKNIE